MCYNIVKGKKGMRVCVKAVGCGKRPDSKVLSKIYSSRSYKVQPWEQSVAQIPDQAMFEVEHSTGRLFSIPKMLTFLDKHLKARYYQVFQDESKHRLR